VEALAQVGVILLFIEDEKPQVQKLVIFLGKSTTTAASANL